MSEKATGEGGESVGETVKRLREDDSEAANNVADTLETSALGAALYAEVLEVSREDVMDAVAESDEVRKEFNRMVGGHEHAFGVALCRHFDHTTVRDGPGGPEPVFLDREPAWRRLLRRLKGRVGR